MVSPLGLGHQAEATRASLLLTCSSSPSLPAVDALALCRPPGAAGSPSPSSSLGPLGHRQPPGGCLLRRPSPPAQPGAHPRGGLPQVPAWDPGPSLSLCPSQLAPLSLSMCLCPPWLPPPSLWPLWTLSCPRPPFVVPSHHRVSACSSFSPSLRPLSLWPSCCLSWIGCLPRLSSLSALGLDGPVSWSRLPLRAPWLCWLTQLRLLSKGGLGGWEPGLVSPGGGGAWCSHQSGCDEPQRQGLGRE